MSEIDSKDMLYKCLECSDQDIVKVWDHRKDGRRCKKCGGHLSPVGYIGIDLAKSEDKTIMGTPPGLKK